MDFSPSVGGTQGAEFNFVMDSAFEYFTRQPLQGSIEERNQIEISPVNALVPGQPIEFLAFGSITDRLFIDLANSKFLFKFKVTKADGSATAADGQVSCATNLAHSIWTRIEAHFNDKMVCDANGLYPYRAYFADLLSRGKLSEESWMNLQGWWARDTAGQMDVLVTTGNGALNKAVVTRNGIMGKGEVVELIMKPHLEIFNSDKFLPPGIKLRLKFTPASNSFVLKRGTGTEALKYTITEAKFYCRYVKATYDQANAVEAALAKYGFMNIWQNHVTLKQMTLAAGSSTADLDNIYFGPIPNRVLVGLVEDSAAAGDYSKNPFNFQHFGTNYISLYVNNRMVPNPPYQPNFAGAEYKYAYDGVLESINKARSERPISLTPDEFKAGYTIWAFDLTPDQNSLTSHSYQGKGSIRLIIKFSTPLTHATTVILHAEYDASITIDKFRNIITNF